MLLQGTRQSLPESEAGRHFGLRPLADQTVRDLLEVLKLEPFPEVMKPLCEPFLVGAVALAVRKPDRTTIQLLESLKQRTVLLIEQS